MAGKARKSRSRAEATQSARGRSNADKRTPWSAFGFEPITTGEYRRSQRRAVRAAARIQKRDSERDELMYRNIGTYMDRGPGGRTSIYDRPTDHSSDDYIGGMDSSSSDDHPDGAAMRAARYRKQLRRRLRTARDDAAYFEARLAEADGTREDPIDMQDDPIQRKTAPSPDTSSPDEDRSATNNRAAPVPTKETTPEGGQRPEAPLETPSPKANSATSSVSSATIRSIDAADATLTSDIFNSQPDDNIRNSEHETKRSDPKSRVGSDVPGGPTRTHSAFEHVRAPAPAPVPASGMVHAPAPSPAAMTNVSRAPAAAPAARPGRPHAPAPAPAATRGAPNAPAPTAASGPDPVPIRTATGPRYQPTWRPKPPPKYRAPMPPREPVTHRGQTWHFDQYDPRDDVRIKVMPNGDEYPDPAWWPRKMHRDRFYGLGSYSPQPKGGIEPPLQAYRTWTAIPTERQPAITPKMWEDAHHAYWEELQGFVDLRTGPYVVHWRAGQDDKEDRYSASRWFDQRRERLRDTSNAGIQLQMKREDAIHGVTIHGEDVPTTPAETPVNEVDNDELCAGRPRIPEPDYNIPKADTNMQQLIARMMAIKSEKEHL